MKLYIAEKPSLARAIAAALPKPQKKHKGYIELANGDCISWCIGHILQQADPEHYDSQFKKWQLAHLPIIPQQWQLTPKAQTRSQLSVLTKLVKKASHIIHAGDPDREGQLLVDEVIDYLNVANSKKQQMKRLLISDLNVGAVKKALNNLQDNSDFMPLSISALARSRADWLYGINLTRAYTLQGQKSGFNGVLSVGRVQTPVLGLVVKREHEIEHFISKDYFQVQATINTELAQTFTAMWQPSEACQPYMDEEGRILHRGLAENVISRIKGQEAQLLSDTQQQKTQAPPLPYNLSALQIDSAKVYSMNAKLVLDVCQNLYEKHQLITYPRSDCRYLPQAHFSQAKYIIDMLAKSGERYGNIAKQADHKIKSKAWNDKKVSAHHAIIPTEKSAGSVNLNALEQQVYYLICRQYLAQFYPEHVYQQRKVQLIIAGGQFVANAKSTINLGWKVLFQAEKKDQHRQDKQQTIPPLSPQQILQCQQAELLAKQTQPPKHFTDASLLSAMTGIARFVSDAKIKRLLRETDGLGTEATRAGIIELLFKRGYLQRKGKNIHATAVGKGLIAALPEKATSADMTAEWELILTKISEKQSRYQCLIQPLTTTISEMINQSSANDFIGLPKVDFPTKAKRKKRYFSKSKGNKVLAKKPA